MNQQRLGELIRTEEFYVESLRVVTEVYIPQLHFRAQISEQCNNAKIRLHTRTVASIFNGIEIIYNLNKTMLESFKSINEQRVRIDLKIQELCNYFIKMVRLAVFF